MASQLGTSFNLAAEKVVSMKEWRQKSKALYKAELSTGEKLFMNLVDQPLGAVAGLVVGIKGLFNQKSKIDGAYFDAEHFRVYVSGAFARNIMEAAQGLMFNKQYQDHVNGLAAKAFEQSEDVSTKPIMQRLIAL